MTKKERHARFLQKLAEPAEQALMWVCLVAGLGILVVQILAFAGLITPDALGL